MPRKPRLHIDGGFYHVILRGNHRCDIFFAPIDRVRFLYLVAEVIERFRMRVHAYCLMSNHVHFAIQVSDAPLGRAMMRIAGRYARLMQRRVSTTGHFFERRYRALLVDADEYLLELVRYIHLNPVRAGMVRDPAEYLWSGHLAYLGIQQLPWLTSDFTLSLFHRELPLARQAYQRFIQAGIGHDTTDTFMVGSKEEPRVLGTDRFLSSLPPQCRKRSALTLQQLIERVCAIHHFSPQTLSMPGRSRQLARLRAVILHHAVHLRIATLSEVARHFNRSASTLSESVDHYRRSDPTLFGPLDLSR